ncbi:unnamed protein product [Polarella glacialis]|uniref:Band 7 domain-containing protein n=1 Tax=Polarella glacialis TaxID=89957 RepID=A0A813CZB7_POLGL|nr:unnamed protein product [Polarella glacialis]CAE8641492.1 unnamed protein product [Polarella glacialis]|mmetsp:Transcript_86726/g.156219  ORF Transcript_86726/g.156219 Transcript_86726/m.156219 type:complete len:355 (+) Transcript_86726:145-1209(+)
MQPLEFGGGQRLGGQSSGSYNRAPADRDDDWPMSAISSNSNVLFGGGACLLLAVIAAAMSLAAVPPLYMGMRYNQFSKAADTENMYDTGRYFIGPFNKFLLFPSSVQSIEFSNEARIRPSGLRYEPLHTRTKEGLGLHLQVSLQYKLRKQELGKLYSEFNMNYELVFVSSVRDVLIKAASEYEAMQLWQDRVKVGETMQKLVDKELRRTYAECWGLQLMIIDLPDGFENSIVQTQVQKQMMLISEQQQYSAKIRAQTSVIEADYERQVKMIMSQGHANYTLVTKSTLAKAEQNKIDVESEVLQSVKQTLGLDPESLVLYQKYGALDDLVDANLIFGFGADQMLIQSGGGSFPAQ